jgi:hypothetical protein
MRRRRLSAALAAVGCTLLLAGAPPAAAHTPYCGITWGSVAKSAPAMTGVPVVGARVGTHSCYDRLVIDLGGTPAGGYDVRYVDGLYNEDTGERVAVAGGATLMVTAKAPSRDANGQPTVPWRWATHIVTPEQFDAGGFATFRDLVSAGSYEGETDVALGVRARLPFRAFTLDGPGGGSRLVIDVAHRW